MTALLDALPLNGYKSYLGAIASIVYGISGFLTHHLDQQTALGFVIGGWTALGVAHKLAKAQQ